MFEVKACKIPGCYEIFFKKMEDKRGSFVKTFHAGGFAEKHLKLELKEEYFTYSEKGVFRGLHFQTPPKALDKLVFCVSGGVTDYLVDLRKGSPSFGEWVSFELNSEKPSAIFAPIGIAHGFYAHSSGAVMQYKVSETYDAAADAGISYTSFSFAKDLKDPIISDRDKSFATFENFQSPFEYKP